ncbi:MFS transporter (plasmid) [Niallia taxi]|uniref:MFS transporter n=1 Tax=Niallia taxi TaxID=2499688 RepID=UPI0023A9B3E0|nr:MFS transporter [Niallia taxi]MDE5054691.1 MFS transporter [Niallia taxi]WOD65805.1 MFS transporter [Niallia taxi]
MKHKYLNMALGLYMSYFLLGMINIILASNMSFLSEQLNVEKTDISLLISVVGVGHLLSINIAGRFSDRYGRKPLVVAATILYMVFLIGIPLTSHYQIAMGLAFIAGICNSLLDSGTYPALNEAFDEASGTATVLLKAFISFGASLLPMMINFFVVEKLFYGLVFFVPALLFLFNGLFLMKVSFPKFKEEKASQDVIISETAASTGPKLWREGAALILLGFSSVSLFTVVQTWLPTYGQEVLHLDKLKSIGLLSFYSTGGLISILLLAVLLKRTIKPITAIVILPAFAFLALLLLIINDNPTLLPIISFCLGLFMSGIFQLTVTVMIELFPHKKGVSVSYVSAAASIAFIVIPFITGLFIKYIGVSSVFMLDLVIAFISTILALFISVTQRNKRSDLILKK